MTNTFHLTVRTPEAEILDQENVTSLRLTTEGGEMEIKAQHATTVGTILFSKMIVSTAAGNDEYIVQRGMLFVSQENKTVQVLVYQCKKVEEIEYKSAKEYLDFVEKQIAEGADLNDFQMKYLQNEKIAMVKQVELVEGK